MSVSEALHPLIDRNQARALLPPAVCKRCIRAARVFVGCTKDYVFQGTRKCSKCAAVWSLGELTARALTLGFITGEEWK